MTAFDGVLLLLGIFGVPLILLVKTQRFRDLGTRMRGAFWGGVIGYAAGILFWGLVTIGPAVMWDPATVRLAGVTIPLLGFGAVGIGVGALIGKKPKERPHRRRRKKKTATTASGQASASKAVPGEAPTGSQG